MNSPKPLPDFSYETQLISEGFFPIAGIDEAGRGPLAGPVVAAAVILDPSNIPKGLNDSKKLKPTQREALFTAIMASAKAVGVSVVDVETIDRINILQANFIAMREALANLKLPPAFALIDGRDVPKGLACPARALIKGDSLSQSIAAASIIAKVTRDRMMDALDKTYPAYGFARHKGYGTKAHIDAIRTHGFCPAHRRSFTPKILRSVSP